MGDIALLIISLGIILLGAEVFVNGVEWLGKIFNLSEGAVGSVLAAVGTALPETLIPIIAILFATDAGAGHEIGIGAILGAPLMLSTLAMFVTGVAVLGFRRRRVTGTTMVAHYDTMSRDLGYFFIVFLVAVAAGLIPPDYRWVQLVIAGGLIISYFVYVTILLKQERHDDNEETLPKCYFARNCENPPRWRVFAQVVVALGLIIFGAEMFVESITAVALHFGVAAFVLALIITPVATELPEKFNSVIWVSRGKDTLALGNITGAMVFQSSLIPAIGILLTDWQLSAGVLGAALLALASAGLLFIELRTRKHISAPMLLLGGLFYTAFIVGVLQGIIHY
ncbi:MAG: sodium:calcium antiporter [Syntrophomonadaceae bacterium]|nr:sodium:calcium antiporter [Syntrophomonadaceae bacterium]